MVVNARMYLCIAATLLTGTLASAQQSQVRAWTEPSIVTVGNPFWFFIEASGSSVAFPTTLVIDGLRIDASSKRDERNFFFSGNRSVSNYKRGFHAMVLQAGTIHVPPIEVTVDGNTMFTKAFKIAAKDPADKPLPGSGGASTPSETTQLTEDDLILIEMSVDKREVYQGEPILLAQEVWNIIFEGISSGPTGGTLNVPPTTEGFYAISLTETQRKEMKKGWRYDVRTERKTLYPTRTGDLIIGPWHWQGVALIRLRRRIFQERRTFNLNAEAIPITVKPLPDRPANFSGAVGTFEAKAALSRYEMLQGVPEKLTVTITGTGNPDAIGAPRFEAPEWAFLTEPTSTIDRSISPRSPIFSVSKSFVYNITPLQSGDLTIPPIDYIWFDPDAGQYRTETFGPFQVTVNPSGEKASPRTLAHSLNTDRGVLILAEDIRPIRTRSDSIVVDRRSGLKTAAAAGAPVLGYALFAFYMMRRRRFETDTRFARAHRAKPNALKALDTVMQSSEPADELCRAILSFIGRTLNLNETGMTSSDVHQHLINARVDPSTADNAAKILRACERARYAYQGLSNHEIHALVQGARAFVNELDIASRKGNRQ